MQKDFKNSEILIGRLYQHNLEVKVTGEASKNPGTPYIAGTIDIATDEEGLNVIPVHFTYVTEFTSTGKKNATYGTLKSIEEGAKTWITDGKDAAMKVRVSTALGLNDFYNNNDELVSAKRNEGGFVNTVNELPENETERNTFRFDMVITSTTRVESEDDENDDFVRVKGAIFNFRKALLPVELVCRDEAGMSYFENLDASASNPVYTQVWGNIVNSTIKHKIEEESAFGGVSVRIATRSVREWRITGARPVEYEFGAEDTITAEELKQMMQDREVYLAEIKQRAEEYKKQKAAATTATPKASNSVPEGEFNF